MSVVYFTSMSSFILGIQESLGYGFMCFSEMHLGLRFMCYGWGRKKKHIMLEFNWVSWVIQVQCRCDYDSSVIIWQFACLV